MSFLSTLYTNEKHYKNVLKGGRYRKEDFEVVYRTLICDEPLNPQYTDHPLVNRKPERDLHIKPDWLLIYKYDGGCAISPK
ncbi:type II toxin-antitoxin system mRNA interferase toxin, RelE/StbE family [Lactobacillus sp. UCMA15818]|uniref:type II toxin-antitoxin system mRNA interferase toxin, RelE/StbE family n=1 Tax=Lactobacillus sp. UCMA15818 TaxID=2583394 RepID=UPI0025B0E426|nr:type II toxin-antitoxin system mRNA interferase toxin, RelE/StbE family [Lactobacillus sp. UCMA15818]MDN2454210.1 type II toxin-antitoxin system mRNA interferase toxin, RelE/StbE family [Lactobacillus sp. UCMA15818]